MRWRPFSPAFVLVRPNRMIRGFCYPSPMALTKIMSPPEGPCIALHQSDFVPCRVHTHHSNINTRHARCFKVDVQTDCRVLFESLRSPWPCAIMLNPSLQSSASLHSAVHIPLVYMCKASALKAAVSDFAVAVAMGNQRREAPSCTILARVFCCAAVTYSPLLCAGSARPGV